MNLECGASVAQTIRILMVASSRFHLGTQVWEPLQCPRLACIGGKRIFGVRQSVWFYRREVSRREPHLFRGGCQRQWQFQRSQGPTPTIHYSESQECCPC